MTLAVGRAPWLGLVHRRMRELAERYGHDFLILTEETHSGIATSGKFAMRFLLDEYERIFYLDWDTLVHPRCPDLFELVPPGCVGGTLERAPMDVVYRRLVLRESCIMYGIDYPDSEDLREQWFNTGVIVFSREHRGLFEPPPELHRMRGLWDMPFFNTQLLRLGFEFWDLGFRFNYLAGLLTKPAGERPPVEDAYVFHATGDLGPRRHATIRQINALWEGNLRRDEHTRMRTRARMAFWRGRGAVSALFATLHRVARAPDRFVRAVRSRS